VREPSTLVEETDGFVTAKLAGHWFALPISAVHEVFLLSRITKVPGSQAGVIGVLNLRGRIVTALDTRQIMGFAAARQQPTMAIGIERRGELFGLAVDEMGDVLTSLPSEREPAPMNLDRRWREIVTGVHRSDKHLVLIVAVDRLFDGVLSLVAA
jgi:purine-binding chemotaxis protein CheW